MISHPYKVIYIHIPKCAGRSICHAFNQHFDHYTAAYYEAAHPQYWQEYTVFTTVKNPYQRLVSMYYYIKKEAFHASHAITNFGNILPFKNWIMENIASFSGEFSHSTTEGTRESHGDMGSSFWFSSQVSRLSTASQSVYSNIHIFKYENGMQAIENFLHQQTGVSFSVAHLNSSHSNSQHQYLRHYDPELLNTVNSFAPFVKDCTMLNYNIVQVTPE